jgi:hypothetical protein
MKHKCSIKEKNMSEPEEAFVTISDKKKFLDHFVKKIGLNSSSSA